MRKARKKLLCFYFHHGTQKQTKLLDGSSLALESAALDSSGSEKDLNHLLYLNHSSGRKQKHPQFKKQTVAQWVCMKPEKRLYMWDFQALLSIQEGLKADGYILSQQQSWFIAMTLTGLLNPVFLFPANLHINTRK